MKKGWIGKRILGSTLDFETKRVWYYIKKQYPTVFNCHNQNQRDSVAWKIAENSSNICTDLNMDYFTFLEHIEILTKTFQQ